MKKILFLLVCINTTLLFANDFTDKLSYGVYIQPNMSSMYFNNDLFVNNHKIRLGLSYGLDVNYKIKERFAILAGLKFKSRGYSYESEIQNYKDSYMKFDVNYNYLCVPLTLKYKIINKSNFSIAAGLGFSTDFFLYVIFKDELLINNTKTNSSEKSYANRYTREINMSYNALLEFKYLLTQNIGVYIQPNYDEMIFSNNIPNNNFSIRFWDLGFKVGLIYKP